MSSSNVVGATPLVSALSGVKTYLDTHKTTDPYKSCRQKFVILVSDGADTMCCGGAGYDTQSDQYKRRRDSVLAAKALADAGYKVFVIGMGSNMPDYLKNTLNWMAYYGGTDNPLVPNAGSTSGFDPASVTSCGASSTTGTCDGTSDQCFATSNDPGRQRFRAMPSWPTTPPSSRRPSGRPSTSSARRPIPSRRPPWPRRGSSTRTTSTRPPSSPSTASPSGRAT